MPASNFSFVRMVAFTMTVGCGTHINFSAGSFARITTIAGAPRIMQFGIKYGF